MVKMYVTAGEGKELFKGGMDLLEGGWEKDGYLTLDEVNLPKYFSSGFSDELKTKIADAFLCDSLGNKQFDDGTKEALRKCLGIKEKTDAGVPQDVGPERKDGGTEGCKKEVKGSATTGCVDATAKVEDEIPLDQLLQPFESVIGQEDFEKSLTGADPQKPVVLLVWSRNCTHCVQAKPEIVKVANEFKDKAEFVGVEAPFPVSKVGNQYWTSASLQYLLPNTFVFEQYSVTGFPTLVFLTHDGKEWKAELVHQTQTLSISEGLRTKLQSR